MCCVKLCPQQAMDVRGYSDFVPMGASATPLRGTEDIMWTVKFRDGSIKRFKFPTRTTPEGSADPLGGYATHDDINNQALATEPESLGLDDVPTR
jgi:adenylylsulfate reductase subunit B